LYVSANLFVCDLRVWYDKSYNSSGRMAMSSKLRKGVIVCSFRTKFEGILSGEFRCPSLFVGCENRELKICLDGFNLLMRVCSGLALNPDYVCKLFCAVT
jgi:hypothetical protein